MLCRILVVLYCLYDRHVRAYQVCCISRHHVYRSALILSQTLGVLPLVVHEPSILLRASTLLRVYLVHVHYP